MLSPQETLLGYISEMFGNITNSSKCWRWMNGRYDVYSSQITTSTMLNPRHGWTPLDYKALDHQLLTTFLPCTFPMQWSSDPPRLDLTAHDRSLLLQPDSSLRVNLSHSFAWSNSCCLFPVPLICSPCSLRVHNWAMLSKDNGDHLPVPSKVIPQPPHSKVAWLKDEKDKPWAVKQSC